MSNGTSKGCTLGLRTEDEAARRDMGIQRVPSGNVSPELAMSPVFKNLQGEIFTIQVLLRSALYRSSGVDGQAAGAAGDGDVVSF
jgi:hypothetical protein